MQFLVLIRP